MSRGLLALIAGGARGALAAQQENQRRAEIEAENKRRERLAVLRLIGENPDAFATEPDQEPEPAEPAKAPNSAQDPDPFGEMPAPTPAPAKPKAGIMAKVSSGATTPNMTEAEATEKVIAHRQRKKNERDARNREAFKGLNLAGEYDPEIDYRDDWQKKQQHDSTVAALKEHYMAMGMSEEDADDMAETGGKVIAERHRADAEKRAENREERATKASERAAVAAERAANKPPAGVETPAALAKRKATWMRARLRELQKPHSNGDGTSTPGLSIKQAIAQAKSEWDLTEGALNAAESDGDGSTGNDDTPVPANEKTPEQLRSMYDAAAAQLRKEGKKPQDIQRILGKRP